MKSQVNLCLEDAIPDKNVSSLPTQKCAIWASPSLCILISYVDKIMNFKRYFTFHNVQILVVTSGLMVLWSDNRDSFESSSEYFPFLYLFAFQSCRYSCSLCSSLRAEGFISWHLISISLSLGLHPEICRKRKIPGQILRPLPEAKLHEHPQSRDRCSERWQLFWIPIAWCRNLEVRNNNQAGECKS